MKVIKAIGEKVIIAPDPTINKIGSIYLPSTVKEQRLNMGGNLATRFKPIWGVVVSVGPGKIDRGHLVPPEVKPGDKVIYGQRGAESFVSGGVLYHQILQEMVLARVEPDCDATVAQSIG